MQDKYTAYTLTLNITCDIAWENSVEENNSTGNVVIETIISTEFAYEEYH